MVVNRPVYMDDIRAGIYFFATKTSEVFKTSRLRVFSDKNLQVKESLSAQQVGNRGEFQTAGKHGEAWRFLETVVFRWWFFNWVFPKVVGVPPKSSMFIGFSIIFTIHFGVPLFLETPNSKFCLGKVHFFKWVANNHQL